MPDLASIQIGLFDSGHSGPTGRGAGVESHVVSGSNPEGGICGVGRAAKATACRAVLKKHREFESLTPHALVCQLVEHSRLEREGWGFESLRAHYGDRSTTAVHSAVARRTGVQLPSVAPMWACLLIGESN